MFACAFCAKRAEIKCICAPQLLCLECADAHIAEVIKKNLPRYMHAYEKANLVISEENRKKLNAEISERIQVLSQCQEIILKKANTLISTTESLAKEVCNTLDCKIFYLLSLAKTRSVTQEQAEEIEKIMKVK